MNPNRPACSPALCRLGAARNRASLICIAASPSADFVLFLEPLVAGQLTHTDASKIQVLWPKSPNVAAVPRAWRTVNWVCAAPEQLSGGLFSVYMVTECSSVWFVIFMNWASKWARHIFKVPMRVARSVLYRLPSGTYTCKCHLACFFTVAPQYSQSPRVGCNPTSGDRYSTCDL
jgi:hypothetical protein